jgi:hypothetical protein
MLTTLKEETYGGGLLLERGKRDRVEGTNKMRKTRSGERRQDRRF